jgi:hypothetical protein
MRKVSSYDSAPTLPNDLSCLRPFTEQRAVVHLGVVASWQSSTSSSTERLSEGFSDLTCEPTTLRCSPMLVLAICSSVSRSRRFETRGISKAGPASGVELRCILGETTAALVLLPRLAYTAKPVRRC